MASRERVDTAQRIAEHRGAQDLTQAELAELAKISLSLLKKIEQGVRTATREVVQALATALDVDPDQLSDDVPPASDRVRAVIPDLRRAIDSYDLPDDGPVRPLDELRCAVARSIERRVASKYNRLARQLPALLPELARAVQQHTGHHREQAAGLLAQAYRAADGIAYKYGYLDLSARLVELMRWAAARTSDELLVAATAYVRTETFFATGNLDAALRALETATSPLRADASVAEGATLGSLHMRAAVVAGRSGNQTAALEHLHEAELVAQGVPEGVYRGTAFGPASVRIHELAVAVELGEAAMAVQRASAWSPPQYLPAERRSHYLIDLAQARLWIGQPAAAFADLQAARRIAPQHVREHPRVRATLSRLLRQRGTTQDDVARFATWARVV